MVIVVCRLMLKLRVEQFCDDFAVKIPSRSSIATHGKEWYQRVFPNSFKNESKTDYFADIICGFTVGEAISLSIELNCAVGPANKTVIV